ncbi:TlpA family protein disulfide reductase [Streptococcus merionis]|uniref:Thioredoxin signature protein n=1 Tax=Streptococcus merionis TaxID=400065 RepID=A0A239SZZ8_9STRE|nr:TlpA disulfide reductase family protein [Streptococcus merionis]SNU90284.1 thioredoxin signature protein [Streptococcus merionis]
MIKSKRWLLAAAMLTVLGALFFLVKQETVKLDAENIFAKSEENSETLNRALKMLGQEMPNFTMLTPDQKEVSIDSFTDKPILLIEWASWCPYCQEQLPVIQEVFDELGSQIHFVALNVTDGREETQATAQKYYLEEGFTFPYYLDINSKVADQLQVETIPTLYIVDKTKKIKRIFVDHQSKDQLTKELKTVLKE